MPDKDLTNREVVDSLESWKFRHWFTPANLVAITAFCAIGWGMYVALEHRVSASEHEIAEEKASRKEQIEQTERRIDRRIDDLEANVNRQFSEQKTDLQNIQNLLYRMLRDNQRTEYPPGRER